MAERQILRIAETAAAQAGDPKPTLIQHSEGTRYDANLVDSGDIVPGKQWSYLIAERGRFVFNDAPEPPGAPPPRGSVLTLIVNASSGVTTDTGLSDRYPKLAKLGPVHTDLRRSGPGDRTREGRLAARVAYAVAIQAVYDSNGNPLLGANFSPDGRLAKPHWAICSPPNVSLCMPVKSTSQSLEPGPSAAGTVFQATASYKGRTFTARTATWTGHVHITRPPALQGMPRAGARVKPSEAAWRGGWQADPDHTSRSGVESGGRAPAFDSLSVEACRTRSGKHCVNLTPQGQDAGFSQQPVTVAARFIGWYLFAFDERFTGDTAFALPGYGSPADIPPLKLSTIVVRSAPEGPVRG